MAEDRATMRSWRAELPDHCPHRDRDGLICASCASATIERLQREVVTLQSERDQLRGLVARWRTEAASEQRVSFCADDLEAILTAAGASTAASPAPQGQPAKEPEPCADCGRLEREHPVTEGDTLCKVWMPF